MYVVWNCDRAKAVSGPLAKAIALAQADEMERETGEHYVVVRA